jgi:predicted HicB family RNase H-like nuclease
MPSSLPMYPLRVPAELKAKAQVRAAKLGVSLNALFGTALEA